MNKTTSKALRWAVDARVHNQLHAQDSFAFFPDYSVSITYDLQPGS